MRIHYLFLFFLFLSPRLFSQTVIKLDFPLDTNLWELGGSATIADFDGVSGEDEILLTPNKNAQIGFIKYRDFINFAQCGKWTLDFEFRLWSEGPNSAGEGFAFTLLNQYEQGDGGQNLGIPQNISSLGLVVAFDTFDNCSMKIHDNPEIQISEIDVYHGGLYYENCFPLSNVRNAKLGSGNYANDSKILRSPNYRPARIIYENKNLSVFVDVDNDGDLEQVLKPTFLNLMYDYGMQMAFTSSTGVFADNQSIKNVVIKLDSKDIFSERTVKKCPGVDLVIDGGLQYISYLWKDSKGNIVGTDKTFIASGPGEYMLEKEFLCGKEYEKIKVEENDLKIVDVKTNLGCGYTELEVFISGGNPGYLYSIKDNAPSQVTNIFKVYKPGTYLVQVQDANNCIVEKSIVVDKVSPEIRLGLIQSSSNEITANASGGTPPFIYQFENRSPGPSNIFEIPGSGTFDIQVVDALGCIVKSTIVIECEPFYIPNYFSPNGDGINDYWKPANLSCYPEFFVVVYDRQGRKIYEFDAKNTTGWDGTYKGNFLPSTDYWYSIKLNEYTEPLTGHFNLYR